MTIRWQLDAAHARWSLRRGHYGRALVTATVGLRAYVWPLSAAQAAECGCAWGWALRYHGATVREGVARLRRQAKREGAAALEVAVTARKTGRAA